MSFNTMLKAIFILSLMVVVLPAFTQVKTAAKPETLVMKETGFDFGRIPQGKPVSHIFQVSNAGKEPLVIENVQASCGCTTPEWTREPLAQGQTTVIRVGYNAEAEGPFEKSITILYNKGESKTLLIRGNVWKMPDRSAPGNASLNLLKNVN
jgi:hypothetical protein